MVVWLRHRFGNHSHLRAGGRWFHGLRFRRCERGFFWRRLWSHGRRSSNLLRRWFRGCLGASHIGRWLCLDGRWWLNALRWGRLSHTSGRSARHGWPPGIVGFGQAFSQCLDLIQRHSLRFAGLWGDRRRRRWGCFFLFNPGRARCNRLRRSLRPFLPDLG